MPSPPGEGWEGVKATLVHIVHILLHCPHQTVLGFDHAQSCLSALFWIEEEAIVETCPLKPIPHADYYVKISPSKLIVAFDELESIRFSCNCTAFATMKLEEILLIPVPLGAESKDKFLIYPPPVKLISMVEMSCADGSGSRC